MIDNRKLRFMLLAAALTPAMSFGSAFGANSTTQKTPATFRCKGIGKGQHRQGMTEQECRQMGGTVEPIVKKAPEKSSTGESWSCRGVGSGHHQKGMTKQDCAKMGGTVEPATTPSNK